MDDVPPTQVLLWPTPVGLSLTDDGSSHQKGSRPDTDCHEGRSVVSTFRYGRIILSKKPRCLSTGSPIHPANNR
jgi:hypothetical protein